LQSFEDFFRSSLLTKNVIFPFSRRVLFPLFEISQALMKRLAARFWRQRDFVPAKS